MVLKNKINCEVGNGIVEAKGLPQSRFGVISDPQFGHARQEKNKRHAAAICIENKCEFVLVPGDLTDTAGAKSRINRLWHRIFFPKIDFRFEDQLGDYKYHIEKPLEKNGIGCYAVRGNHDTYTGPLNFVKYHLCRKYGMLKGLFGAPMHYKRELSSGIVIYGLDIYPTKKIMKWLTKVYDNSKPAILFFHYPPTSGDYPISDHLDTFLQNPVLNLPICIVVGHWHQNRTVPISKNEAIVAKFGETVPVICAGGRGAAICEFDKKVKWKFIHK